MSVTLQQLARDLPVNLAVLVGTVEPNHQAHTTGENLYLIAQLY